MTNTLPSFLSILGKLPFLATPKASQPVAQAYISLQEAARLDSANLLQRLHSRAEGLREDEVEERQQLFGMNHVTTDTRRSLRQELLHLLLNPLNIMLLGLAAVNFLFLDDPKSGSIVTAMIVLSVGLTFFQEHRSSRAAEKLRAMVSTTTLITRLHETLATKTELPVETVVPGDIISLSAGDIIPADMRILTARDLFINQSALTGEAMPVERYGHTITTDTKNILETPNLVFMGSHVLSGSAQAVAISTGTQTYFGALAKSIMGKREKTGFERGITNFTWMIIRFILIMVPLVFLINGLTKGNWLEALVFAMSVSVGLTPEMLPMIVSVNLSKGALAMARKKVIVKRLNSIQNFGAMDVLCTDKTGTLTQDKVIMKRHVDLNGKECDDVLRYAYLNSYYQSGLKNLLDVAVLEHVEVRNDLHIDDHAYDMVDEIPFDFVRRRMSVVVSRTATKQHILICKGAFEEILSVCSKGELDGKSFDMTQEHREQMQKLARELNEDGFRVIAVAHKDMPNDHAAYGVADETDLTLIGYIAFLDPPKESARAAIAALERYGVSVKILTGDNDIVTRKTCKDVNLTINGMMLGHELDTLSDDALAARAETTTVFAKLSPTQKARVIAALHKNGHVVGYLGDGINDSPALKAADVGISVDSGADIAKESADIILLEKSLLVLEEGVLEGRKVFGNILKYIKMGASSNFGNMFSVLGASAWLPFLPMQPIQVLFTNLLYDVSQTATPTDNVDEDYLLKPRSWDIGYITKFILTMGPISSLFDYITFAIMYFVFAANKPEMAPLFQTAWFLVSLISQTLIIHVIRTDKVPFRDSRASWPVIAMGILICSIGIWLPLSPFADSLGFTAMPASFWPILIAIVICYVALTQKMKGYIIRRIGWK